MQAEIVGAASSKVHPGDTDAAGSNVDTSSWEEWDVCQSLFDNNISSSLDANLRYMYKNYGFFLPDVEYLQDPDGLIKCAPAAARPSTPLLSLADLSQPTAASLWDEHTPRRPTRQLLRLTPLSPRTLLTVTRATAPHLDPTLHANLSADIHTAGHARSIPAATHGEHITPSACGQLPGTVSCSRSTGRSAPRPRHDVQRVQVPGGEAALRAPAAVLERSGRGRQALWQPARGAAPHDRLQQMHDVLRRKRGRVRRLLRVPVRPSAARLGSLPPFPRPWHPSTKAGVAAVAATASPRCSQTIAASQQCCRRYRWRLDPPSADVIISEPVPPSMWWRPRLETPAPRPPGS